MKRVMLSLGEKQYGQLYRFAEEANVKIQELLRVKVIPEWLHWQTKAELKEGS